MMNYPDKARVIASWRELLQDSAALLARPGGHHKELVKQARALHEAQLIDCHELGDLLEQADGALAYAIEALLDRPDGE